MKRTIIDDDHRVWASVEMTVNLGNYENIKIQLGESRTLGPKEDPSAVKQSLMEDMLAELSEKKDDIKEEMRK